VPKKNVKKLKKKSKKEHNLQYDKQNKTKQNMYFFFFDE
jgi:hypothetical protein